MYAFTCFPFFFSSRRRHTRSDRDWSSDVCSSDLRRFGNDPPFPDGVEHIVLADHPITVADQVDEQIEDLRPDVNQLGAAPQLAAIHVERISTELKWHSGPPPRAWRRGPPRRRKIKAISRVNKARVKALPARLRHRRT